MLSSLDGYFGGATAGHSCVVSGLVSTQCWGDNTSWQLGTGNMTSSSTPVVANVPVTAALSMGKAFTCAITEGGAVRCWGHNDSGQLGNGTTTRSLTPVKVTGIETAIALSAGDNHTCALLADRTVQCWGNNESLQLGQPAGVIRSTTPVSIASLSGVKGIAAGAGHTCVLMSNGSVRCWGLNHVGQLGNNTRTKSGSPVPVQGW